MKIKVLPPHINKSFEGFALTEDQDIYFGLNAIKNVGENIISGTVSIDADVKYRVTKDFAHSTMSNIVALLENAMNNKPKIQQLANKLSEYFSEVILALSFITFIIYCSPLIFLGINSLIL